jgi:hypothetical protein
VKLEEENIEGDSCGMNNSTILNTNRFWWVKDTHY